MSDNIEIIPDNKNDDTHPPKIFKWVMYMVFALLILAQVSKLYTGPSMLERKHKVNFFKNPIDISRNYFETMDGEKFNFSVLEGKSVIIAFWAPWCPHCKSEIPQMSSLSDELARLDYQMIPLVKNVEPKKSIDNFYTRYNIYETEPYITGDRELYQKLRIIGIPQFILVNKNGYAVATMRPNWTSGDALTLFSELKNLL